MNPEKSRTPFELKRLQVSFFIPFTFIVLAWLVKIVEVVMGFDFSAFGIFPQQLKGLPGIVLSPFLHGDFWHLFSNTVPFLFLLTGIFYFFPRVGFRIFLLTWILTGFYVWLGGREAYHIGASGLVYGFAAFLFTSGILSRDNRMLALTLTVAFLYGNMIWGVFPLIKKISWESHLLGMLTGVVLAFIYRMDGPPPPVYSWDLNPEEEEGTEDHPEIGEALQEDQSENLAKEPKPDSFPDSRTIIHYEWTPGKKESGNKPQLPAG